MVLKSRIESLGADEARMVKKAKTNFFEEILGAAGKLFLEELEALIDVLSRRAADR